MNPLEDASQEHQPGSNGPVVNGPVVNHVRNFRDFRVQDLSLHYDRCQAPCAKQATQPREMARSAFNNWHGTTSQSRNKRASPGKEKFT